MQPEKQVTSRFTNQMEQAEAISLPNFAPEHIYIHFIHYIKVWVFF